MNILRPSALKSQSRRSRPLGAKANAIRDAVVDLTADYRTMTVRQVFYQLVSRGIVPKEETGGYRPVQAQVLKMRREGDLSWRFIADSTRWQRKPETWAARTVERGLRDYSGEASISFRRLAVTPEQIREWDLPTRPATQSDPEAHKFGANAVELDAIAPDKLMQLVENEIVALIDLNAWAMEKAVEENEIEMLGRLRAA